MVFAIYTIFISFSHSPSEVTIIIPVYGWANWSLTRSCPIAEWWSCHSKWEFLLYTVSCICPIRGALPRPCWVMPCRNFCVCWASAFSERPGPVWSSAVQQERAGCRPHSPLSVETPCSTISLVNLPLLCHIRLPASQGSSIIPRVLLQGQRLAEVFTCLKMYQAINRSYFPSLLRSWVCSFLSFSSPFVSFNKGEKE